MRTLTVSVAALAAVAVVSQSSAQDLKPLSLLSGPLVDWDAIWMASSKGLYDEDGLDVDISIFPSGTTALQAFQAGQGDIVSSGDLPSVNYWKKSGDYRVINVISRSTQMEVTALNEIQKPEDLIGQTVATRVGSTGSWFVSEYLKQNGIDESKVNIINLDTGAMPTALCGKDIAAFFIWEPFPTRTKEICPETVHTLAPAEGYVSAYSVIGARKSWLDTEEGRDLATRFLRATLKGKEIASTDFDSVSAYASEHFGYKPEDIRTGWELVDRAEKFDQQFYKDFCSLSSWMVTQELLTEPLNFDDFIWTEGLNSIDPSLVEKASSC